MSNKKVLVTGATGLVGTELVKQLHQQNIIVHYLTTSKSKIENRENYKGFYWNITTNEIDKACLDGVSAIFHLAGASIAKRWTSSYKKEIIESRVASVALLKRTLNETNHQVNHIIAASAVGIYEDNLQVIHTEDSDKLNDGFLGKVVKLWEAATKSFETLNLPVTQVRIGLVLSKKGGAFTRMSQPIKFGVGAPFGHGKQWQSWIHLEDLAAIFTHVMNGKHYGVYNAVAPHPVTNKELTKAIAKHYNKPLWLPGIPKFVMNILLGEMHTILYESQKVSSEKLLASGFQFKIKQLKDFLG